MDCIVLLLVHGAGSLVAFFRGLGVSNSDFSRTSAEFQDIWVCVVMVKCLPAPVRSVTGYGRLLEERG